MINGKKLKKEKILDLERPSSYELVDALNLMIPYKHDVIHKNKIILWSLKHKVNSLHLFYNEKFVFTENAQKDFDGYIYI